MRYMVISGKNNLSAQYFETLEDALMQVQGFGGYIVKLVEVGEK